MGKDYSWTVTKSISALDWFLQIIVYGNTGKWSIAECLRIWKKNWIIEENIVTDTLLKNLQSVISQMKEKKPEMLIQKKNMLQKEIYITKITSYDSSK